MNHIEKIKGLLNTEGINAADWENERAHRAKEITPAEYAAANRLIVDAFLA